MMRTTIRRATSPEFDADTIHVELGDGQELRIYAYLSDMDGVPVVQIDTDDNPGRMQVYINDGPVYDADPETNIGPMPQQGAAE